MIQPASRSVARRHLPALDGIRAIAVTAVLFLHLSRTTEPASATDAVFFRLWWAGWAGVDIFFVLSGFLITTILLDARDRPGAGYFTTFYTRRTLRIFPLYYAYLILLLIASFMVPGVPAVEYRQTIGWHAGYLSNVLTAWRDWPAVRFYTGHLWSLAIEEQFYLLWPLVVHRLGLQRLRALCFVGAAAVMGLRTVAVWLRFPMTSVYVLTPFRADALLIGAYVATLHFAGDAPAQRRLVRTWPWIGIAVALATSYQARALLPGGWVQAVGYTGLAMVAASVIVWILNAAPSSRVLGILSSRPFTTMGKYSYAVYLLHVPILALLVHYIPESLRTATVGQFRTPILILDSVLFTATMWCVGALSWYLFERHFAALKERLTAGRRPAIDQRGVDASLPPSSARSA